MAHEKKQSIIRVPTPCESIKSKIKQDHMFI